MFPLKMVIFHSYVSLPEGNWPNFDWGGYPHDLENLHLFTTCNTHQTNMPVHRPQCGLPKTDTKIRIKFIVIVTSFDESETDHNYKSH